MWKIGDIKIKGKVVLAPMAGYTSLGYRKFFKKFGVDVVYSEMVSDMGLIYGNKAAGDKDEEGGVLSTKLRSQAQVPLFLKTLKFLLIL